MRVWAPAGPKHSLCDPFPQLAAGGVRVGGEKDQAALGVVHVAGFSASAVLTLRQWIPGYPRSTEPFLQGHTMMSVKGQPNELPGCNAFSFMTPKLLRV